MPDTATMAEVLDQLQDTAWDSAVETCADLVRSSQLLPPQDREAMAEALISTAKGQRSAFQQQADAQIGKGAGNG